MLGYRKSFSRISIGANYLNNIPKIFFLISGKNKQNIIRRIMNDSPKKELLPFEVILNSYEGEVKFLIDSQADYQ